MLSLRITFYALLENLMNEPHLLYQVRDHVAMLTINRPKKRNALSPQAITLFLEALDQADNNPAVHVVLVTGAGDRAFCSGADLGSSMGGGVSSFDLYASLIKRLAGFPKPTVARVNGYCLAGGMGVMLACDIVIAREDSQFGTPEVNVGIWPMMIGALIFRNLHRKHAFEMCLLGERFNAAQAVEMGMVTRAVSAENLDNDVAQTVAKLAAKSPIGMRLGKEAFYTMADMPYEQAVDYLSGKLAEVLATSDAKEGIAAFMEKRRPNFTGT